MQQMLTDSQQKVVRDVLITLNADEQRVLMGSVSADVRNTYSEIRALCYFPEVRFGEGQAHHIAMEEIGLELGHSVEMIYDIENRAIRKLSHPSRLNRLKNILGFRLL
jgi:DNA-directed RNA polymerase sigma subunit (sigma70/sigma32)